MVIITCVVLSSMMLSVGMSNVCDGEANLFLSADVEVNT